MKLVTLRVESGDDAVPVTATIRVETKDGDTWVSGGKDYKVLSGGSAAERRVMLDVGQRLVVEGSDEPGLVYDKEQMMAVPAPVEAPPEGDTFRAKRQIDEHNKAKVEGKAGYTESVPSKADPKYETKDTKVGQSQPLKPPPVPPVPPQPGPFTSGKESGKEKG